MLDFMNERFNRWEKAIKDAKESKKPEDEFVNFFQSLDLEDKKYFMRIWGGERASQHYSEQELNLETPNGERIKNYLFSRLEFVKVD
jgi:hypothetical protein